MLRKIESLRKKPKEVRNQYAFYGACIVTGFIAILWALSLPARFDSVNATEDTSDKTGGVTRALADIKESIGAAVTIFRDSLVTEVDTPTTTADTAEEETGTIDIAAMFATSSATATKTPDKKEQRHILIGTSSPSKTATTTP